MTSLAAQELKELVRSRTDIVQLIGESLTLHPERGGRSFKGLCPFHPDHNPSMAVNPERQSYRCWVCNKGGDCFSWVMEYEGVGFREAMESLAQRAGVELPKFTGPRESDQPDKSTFWDVLTWAEQEFHRALLSSAAGQRGRDYLRSRKFRDETISQFHLGFHPDDSRWIQERARDRYPLDRLLSADLARESERGGGCYEWLTDRVVFPIHDERGRCVAFGGRILPDSRQSQNAKYINSRETPVFQKSRLVFALNHARDAIRRTETVVVMEGYADCIKAHQAGVVNAVATLGTALTETHVTILKRLARRVILVYDGDDAGKRAARRAIESFLAQDVDLRLLTLPDELDPDEFLDANGVDAFEALIEQAPEAWEYQLQHCLATYGVRSVDARLRTLDEMLTLLNVSPGMAGSIKESVLLAGVATRLGIAEPDARSRLRDLRGRPVSRTVAKLPAGELDIADAAARRRAAVESLQRSPSKDDLLECELLGILFTAPHTIEVIRQDVGLDDLQHEALRELLACCFDTWDHGELPEFGRVLATLECPHLKGLAVWVDEQAQVRGLRERLVQDESATTATTGENATEEGLVSRILRELKWRRVCASRQAAQGEAALQLHAANGLTPNVKELLQQAAQFHQQRSAKRPRA